MQSSYLCPKGGRLIQVLMYIEFTFTSKRNMYCEIIINRGVLIFVDFVVHLNYEN
jgi:hypothetical protein